MRFSTDLTLYNSTACFISLTLSYAQLFLIILTHCPISKSLFVYLGSAFWVSLFPFYTLKNVFYHSTFYHALSHYINLFSSAITLMYSSSSVCILPFASSFADFFLIIPTHCIIIIIIIKVIFRLSRVRFLSLGLSILLVKCYPSVTFYHMLSYYINPSH